MYQWRYLWNRIRLKQTKGSIMVENSGFSRAYCIGRYFQNTINKSGGYNL